MSNTELPNVMNVPYFVTAKHSKIRNTKIDKCENENTENNCYHFLEFHDTEHIAWAWFVHDDDIFGLHTQYRWCKSTHPNARLSALGFPTYMYMYVELRKSL